MVPTTGRRVPTGVPAVDPGPPEHHGRHEHRCARQLSLFSFASVRFASVRALQPLWALMYCTASPEHCAAANGPPFIESVWGPCCSRPSAAPASSRSSAASSPVSRASCGRSATSTCETAPLLHSTPTTVHSAARSPPVHFTLCAFAFTLLRTANALRRQNICFTIEYNTLDLSHLCSAFYCNCTRTQLSATNCSSVQ